MRTHRTSSDHGNPRVGATDLHASASIERRPLIIVSVGTDHHRFDRLVRWMDDFSRLDHDVRIVVQRGTSSTPRRVDSRELIPHAELCELFASSDAVVCHGGPSTVMDARRAGRRPIVVPRDPAHDEHVDGHQMRFARHLETHDMAFVATEQHELFAALEQVLADPSLARIPPHPSATAEGVVRFGAVLDDLLGVATPLENPDLTQAPARRAS